MVSLLANEMAIIITRKIAVYQALDGIGDSGLQLILGTCSHNVIIKD
jgi:hypothetical protein